MLEAGEDARFIARRMVIFASEDVGMADPQALVVAVAAAHALELVGLPEAQLNLAQAVIHLATAPKSNRSALAIWNARADVAAGALGEVPAAPARQPLPGRQGARPRRRATSTLMSTTTRLGGWVDQQYLPDELADRRWYRPSRHGHEEEVAERDERPRRHGDERDER